MRFACGQLLLTVYAGKARLHYLYGTGLSACLYTAAPFDSTVPSCSLIEEPATDHAENTVAGSRFCSTQRGLQTHLEALHLPLYSLPCFCERCLVLDFAAADPAVVETLTLTPVCMQARSTGLLLQFGSGTPDMQLYGARLPPHCRHSRPRRQQRLTMF